MRMSAVFTAGRRSSPRADRNTVWLPRVSATTGATTARDAAKVEVYGAPPLATRLPANSRSHGSCTLPDIRNPYLESSPTTPFEKTVLFGSFKSIVEDWPFVLVLRPPSFRPMLTPETICQRCDMRLLTEMSTPL